MESIFNSVISVVDDFLWSKLLIAVLIILGVYFTTKSKFVQFRFFGEMFRLLGDKESHISKDKKSVSSLQAFFISTASRVGTGNVAGVALAIALGGPGAVFWMWIVALLGSATAFVESTLAQIYKIKDSDGFRGGPAYYMEKGLGMRGLGIAFSIIIMFCFGLAFNSVQSNTIASAFDTAFGINKSVMGIILAILTAIIIFGGVNRIAKATQIIVPIMATLYLLVALFIVITNITALPSVIMEIVTSAFGLNEAIGGTVGAALMMGVKRGLFSNEAGMGSAPNAAATANISHPVKQGLIQALGVFFDTLVICSATAFMILLSDINFGSDLKGVDLTQAAMSNHLGSWANIFIAVTLFFFAFSSVVGNYYYGETNLEFIKKSKTALNIFRLAVISIVYYGAVASLQTVWNLADLFMGIMAVLNLFAIALLGKYAFSALKDYAKQRKAGKNPVFYAKNIKGLENVECWQDEDKSAKKGA